MKAPAFLTLALLVGFARPASAGPALALEHGEHLTYRVSWAVVPGAGEIVIDAQRSAETPSHLVVTSQTATRRLAKMLLPFEARAEAVFDLQSGRMITLREASRTRGKAAEHTVAFDYTRREATHDRIVPDEAPRMLPIPDGDPVDLMVALLQTRTWNLKPGEKQDALVLFDDDFYELTIHATNYQEIRTPVGRFNTLVLEPRMEKTPPKGMFRRGSTVRVWIAQDEHRLPVRFEVAFKIGTGTASLEKYRGPTNGATPPLILDAKNPGP